MLNPCAALNDREFYKIFRVAKPRSDITDLVVTKSDRKIQSRLNCIYIGIKIV